MIHTKSKFYDGIEVRAQKPLDVRTIVTHKEDLYKLSTWPHDTYIDESGVEHYTIYMKEGMSVTVTGTKENPIYDLYILTDLSKILNKDYSGWKLVAGGSGGNTNDSGNIDGGRADESYTPSQNINSGDAYSRGEYVDDEEVLYVNSAEDLLQSINTTPVISLVSDSIELNNTPIVVEDNEVKIYLNNSKITGGLFTESGGNILEGNTDSYGIWAKEGSTVIIEGNAGCIEAVDAKYSMAVWANGGTVIINGGTYINNGDACDLIYASNGGRVIINGGEFKATNNRGASGTKNPYSALNVKDADYVSGKSSISVRGGRFFKFDPSNNLSEGPNTNFVDEGYKVVKDGDWFVVVKK